MSENINNLPNGVRDSKTWSRPYVYSHARYGLFRRQLSLLNPRWYFLLSELLSTNWSELIPKRWSPLSASTPTERVDSPRALDRRLDHWQLPELRARFRASARYLLRTDITRFYASVYTHSIPWAVHGKEVAKQKTKDKELLGNKIDKYVSGAQDGQTLGIPVGPDSSLLLAERLLHTVDGELKSRRIRGFRYIDDYEFAFRSHAEAEDALSQLEVGLAKYGLEVNPLKTQILELPTDLDSRWIRALRDSPWREEAVEQARDLIAFFDTAFDLSTRHRGEGVLRFALGQLGKRGIASSNWNLALFLLLQTMQIDGGSIPRISADIVQRVATDHHAPRTYKSQIKEALSVLFERHAPLGHASEVAWGLWLCSVLNIGLDKRACRLVSGMDDSIVALLALDANERGLAKHLDLQTWSELMTVESLRGEQWLLAYEARVRNWLPSAGGGDHVASDPFFGFLKDKNVRFYDENKAGAQGIAAAAQAAAEAPAIVTHSG